MISIWKSLQFCRLAQINDCYHSYNNKQVMLRRLILFSIYTHSNTMKKKKLWENIVGKGETAQDEQFHLFQQCFLWNLYIEIL